MADDFKPIETQEQLDEILKGRLERDRKKTAERYADYDELKAKVAASDEREKKLIEERDAARAEAAESAAKLTRIEVARAAGLRPELADRIKGATREEMEADAKTLASLQSPVSPLQSYKPAAESTTGDEKTSAYRSMLSSLRPQ